MASLYNRHHRAHTATAVYVGRGTPFGNVVAMELPSPADRLEAVAAFERHLKSDRALLARVRRELRGRDLLCSCKPALCHGDVLFYWANVDAEFAEILKMPLRFQPDSTTPLPVAPTGKRAAD